MCYLKTSYCLECLAFYISDNFYKWFVRHICYITFELTIMITNVQLFNIFNSVFGILTILGINGIYDFVIIKLVRMIVTIAL